MAGKEKVIPYYSQKSISVKMNRDENDATITIQIISIIQPILEI